MGIPSGLWHPYTQMKTFDSPLLITRGKGAYLIDEKGNSYLDAHSSWWVNLHGHCHPFITEKIKTQLDILEHAAVCGCTHFPAETLSRKLIEILPGKMQHIFYSDNGSTAVETALKIALQYWFNKNPNTKRTKILSMRKGFHGETFACMSLSGKSPFNLPFQNHLFEVETIDPPFEGHEEESLLQLEKILAKETTACFIYEPLLLGALGGMITYSKKGLSLLLEMCRHFGVITIADEVLTGFGRTGSYFASDNPSQSPDIICLAKSLTGGYLPLGATACTQPLFETFLSNEKQKALLHGHSYTANPLACTAALASIELLFSKKCERDRLMIAKSHETFASTLTWNPKIKRITLCGTILALELIDHSGYFSDLRDQIELYFLDKGILLRPLGNVLYLIPPYCITKKELHQIYITISTFLDTQ